VYARFFLHLLKYNIIRGKGEKNNNLKTLALETQKIWKK
jgi:hypothetical protein